MKTFDPRPKAANLRLFVGAIFLVLGFLTGTLLGLTILKRQSFLAIIVGVILFGFSLLIRSEWNQWKEWLRPYASLGCFMVGFAVGVAIFAVDHE